MCLLHNTIFFSTESKEPESGVDCTIPPDNGIQGTYLNAVLSSAVVVRNIAEILNCHSKYMSLFLQITVEQKSLSGPAPEQLVQQDHSYWSGASWLSEIQPIQQKLVGVNISTNIFSLVNVHCCSFCMFFYFKLCFAIHFSATLCFGYHRKWSRTYC